MDAEEFSAAIGKTVTEAKDGGLDVADIITELEGAITALKEENAE